MYLCHFLPNDLYYLTYTIQKIITNSLSPPNRRTMTPVAEVNLEVDSLTTTPKVITSGSSLGFEGNVCEDTISSQSSYKLNSGCLYYEASIAPNPKLWMILNHQKNSWKQFIGESWKRWMNCSCKLLGRKPFLPWIIKAKPSILILLKFKPKMLFFGFLMILNNLIGQLQIICKIMVLWVWKCFGCWVW